MGSAPWIVDHVLRTMDQGGAKTPHIDKNTNIQKRMERRWSRTRDGFNPMASGPWWHGHAYARRVHRTCRVVGDTLRSESQAIRCVQSSRI